MSKQTSEIQIIRRMLGWAALFEGANTLADVMPEELISLAERVGVAGALDHITLDLVAEEVAASLEVGSHWNALLPDLDERDRYLIRHQIFPKPEEKMTLESIAQRWRVTQSRVGQVKVRTDKKITTAMGGALMHLSRVLASEMPLPIRTNDWDALTQPFLVEAPRMWHEILQRALVRQGPIVEAGGWYWSRNKVEELDAELRSYASANPFGLVDPADVATEEEDGLTECILNFLEDTRGWTQIGRFLIERPTRADILAAVLETEGEPITTEQIYNLLQHIPSQSLRSVLTGQDRFVKVSKSEWALSSWGMPPYEGGIAEIEKRIEEGNGSASVSELLHELPRKFGISRSTVEVYLSSRHFIVEGDIVRVNANPSVNIPPLSDEESIVWAGDIPVLKVVATSDALRGLSIIVPRGVADKLGVEIGGNAEIPVDSPSGVRPLTIRWRTYSEPYLGRLSHVFRKFGSLEGGRLFVELRRDGLVVTKDASRYSTTPSSSSRGPLTSRVSPPQGEPPESTEQFMKNFRRRRSFGS